MSEKDNLEQRAAAALERAKAAQNQQYDAVPAEDATVVAVLSEDDEYIVSGSDQYTPKPTEEDETIIFSSIGKEQLGNMPEKEQQNFLQGVLPDITSYRKQLILEYGMTPAEATQAAQNRMKSKASEAKKAWDEEHPDSVIVTIDKSQEKTAEFTEDERQKMMVAKALKLVIVDSQELETIKIKPENDTVPMSNIRDICSSLSQYSVPLLQYGDYATFAGAQTGALVNATTGEDDDMLDIIDKKASLLYRQFVRGTLMARTTEEPDPKSRTGRTIKKEMSYDDFCNWFRYDDMDMGVYAIVTASAMETSESTYPCPNKECQKPINVSYNNKSLLDLSEIPDEFKSRLTEIDEARSSMEKMKNLRDKYAMNIRVKSPFSNNMYDIGSISIADARNRISQCMDQMDGMSNLLDLLLLLYLDKIYVYDNAAGDYTPISVGKNPSDAFDIICRIHQVDLELLYKFIQDHTYAAQFKLKIKCPYCGYEGVERLSVDNMIFLHARASLTEIQ